MVGKRTDACLASTGSVAKKRKRTWAESMRERAKREAERLRLLKKYGKGEAK
jgi:hypothetical protein